MTARDGAVLRLQRAARARPGSRVGGSRAGLQLLATRSTTDELRHDAALVAYELVANAVMHGHPDPDGTVELVCELVGDQLLVRVRDAGSQGAVEPIPLEPEAGNGRGLAIVDALPSSWSMDRSEGTVIRALVPLPWRASESARAVSLKPATWSSAQMSGAARRHCRRSDQGDVGPLRRAWPARSRAPLSPGSA